jgi:hypothetical protein
MNSNRLCFQYRRCLSGVFAPQLILLYKELLAKPPLGRNIPILAIGMHNVAIFL